MSEQDKADNKKEVVTNAAAETAVSEKADKSDKKDSKPKKAAKTDKKDKDDKNKVKIKPEIYDIIRTPVITEKATNVSEFNQVVFKVASNATKPKIKQAVEGLFDTKVIKVNISNVKGKEKKFRGQKGFRSGYKKATVTLAEGEKIDVMGGI